MVLPTQPASTPTTFFQKSRDVYHLASKKIETFVVNLSDYDNAAFAKLIGNPKHFGFQEYDGGRFRYCKQSDSFEDSVALPFGQYRHVYDPYGGGDLREWLAPFDVRKNESYLEIPELGPFLTDMKTFLASQELYKDLGFPYRRGYIAYGPPGNGKTTMIRQLLQMPEFSSIHCIWLSRLPSDQMVEALNKINSTKIVIFEEISPEDQNVDFSQSELLTFMDGESSLTNCITIATTNYPFLLAKNLADRPSRFDFKFEFKNPTISRIYDLLSSLLGRTVTEDEVEMKSMSFAQVKEVVLQHKMFGVSLKEAQDKVIDQSKLFEKGFEEKKPMGFGIGDD